MATTTETVLVSTKVVTEHKLVQIAEDIITRDDGVETKRVRFRRVLTPDMTITGESSEIQTICNNNWTQTIKDAWATKQANPLT